MKKRNSAKSICPLTTSPRKRNEADRLAASDKDHLPAGLALPALATAGYSDRVQLARISEADLTQLHGVGPKSPQIIRQALKKRGNSASS